MLVSSICAAFERRAEYALHSVSTPEAVVSEVGQGKPTVFFAENSPESSQWSPHFREIALKLGYRLSENQSGKRKVVVVMRERAGRTLTYVAKREADGVALARKSIAEGSTVHADEASHWDQLAANFPIKRVNHQHSYSDGDANTNQS